MAANRTGKRKSKDLIYEISDDDLSPEHESNCRGEPQPKVMKFLESELQCEDSNLKAKEARDDIVNISSEIEIVDDIEDEVATCELKPAFKEPENVICNLTCTDSIDLEDGEVEEHITDQTDFQDVANNSICITFSNKSIADSYKSKFIKFLESFAELETVIENDSMITVQRDDILNPNEWVIVDETQCFSDSKVVVDDVGSVSDETTPKKKKKKQKKEKDLFVLDTTPSREDKSTLLTRYSSKFQIEISEKSEGKEMRVSAQACFNCKGSHSLKDCPVPKDYNKINASRQRFRNQKQTSRYHLEEDQKYGHLSPGIISDNLRNALGLRKDQLPPYIYRMRMLGYPYGWLEEAKFVHSNLDLFDPEGNTVRQGAGAKSQGLDPEKVINYPGFNAPLDKGTRDDYKQQRVPAYSENHSKKVMIDYYQKQIESQMGLNEADESNKKSSNKHVLENPCVKNLKPTVATETQSLPELEKQKETLLAALDDNSNSNVVSEENSNEQPEKLESTTDKEQPIDQQSKVSTDEPLEVNVCMSDTIEPDEMVSPTPGRGATAVNTMFGTPILKSGSPYSRLPNPDNFMQGVSPVINFENLPDSTGMYEKKMTGVIKKVRNKLKLMQNCNS